LLQFVAGGMAQAGAIAVKVMGSKLLDTCTSRSLPNNFSNCR